VYVTAVSVMQRSFVVVELVLEEFQAGTGTGT
jgi:hypothetical protein